MVRNPSYPLTPAIVQRANLRTLLSADGTSQTQATFQLRSKAPYLEVQLPENAVLWSAVLDGTPLKPQKQGTVRLIGLPPAASGAVRNLQLVYEVRVKNVTNGGQLKLLAPRLLYQASQAAKDATEIPLVNIEWTVTVPDGYEAVATDGTMEARPMAPQGQVSSLSGGMPGVMPADRPVPAPLAVAGVLYELGGGVHEHNYAARASEAKWEVAKPAATVFAPTRRAAGVPVAKEKSDRLEIGEIEETPAAALDVDPTLHRPAQAAQEQKYNDDNNFFEHRRGGAATGAKAVGAAGGAVAFGPGPRVTENTTMGWTPQAATKAPKAPVPADVAKADEAGIGATGEQPMIAARLAHPSAAPNPFGETAVTLPAAPAPAAPPAPPSVASAPVPYVSAGGPVSGVAVPVPLPGATPSEVKPEPAKAADMPLGSWGADLKGAGLAAGQTGKQSYKQAKLSGFRSLKIDVEQTGMDRRQLLTFTSLGADPHIGITLARRDRTESLVWGIALAVFLLGVALTRRPVRQKVALVLGLALASALVPLFYDTVSMAMLCNGVFYAASLLVPYYLAAGLVCWILGRLRGLASRITGTGSAAATVALVLALVTLLSAAAQAQPAEEKTSRQSVRSTCGPSPCRTMRSSYPTT